MSSGWNPSTLSVVGDASACSSWDRPSVGGLVGSVAGMAPLIHIPLATKWLSLLHRIRLRIFCIRKQVHHTGVLWVIGAGGNAVNSGASVAAAGCIAISVYDGLSSMPMASRCRRSATACEFTRAGETIQNYTG